MSRITDEASLRALYGPKLGRSVDKELTALDAHCRAFIAASPYLVMSTSGTEGLDLTPRGDEAGFVVVDDDTTLLLPDRPGNNRLDALTNLLTNPEIGLIFLIPTVRETLRIRGTAEIRDDQALRERTAHKGHLPATVLRISITRAYMHCAKSALRSGLWQPDTWPQDRPVGTMAEMMRDHAQRTEPLESDEDMVARYRQNLY
ncbi:MSMEG_1061 family FMN-dependent PPOX-type flavoprotein [Pontivivens ytuae]|uniref:Pyridoxamine 5'-phosphate oxidase family protein n=1 Tax=Pontivivens ytuae TaxID=2789856 RepID=A0A7S9LV34_9RHOB|nr:MSMEG_1061 family FMN-dependent PPOX-type flavoprotein [Pontivivens ytuae]QPH55876.1 pyridoxamine 5'-phosphate oxidase family protein [Pontivivens ytuae]